MHIFGFFTLASLVCLGAVHSDGLVVFMTQLLFLQSPDETSKQKLLFHKPHIFCRFTKESQSVTRTVGSLSNQFHLFFLLLWKIGGCEGRDRPTPPQYNPASISPYNSPPPVNPTVLPIPGMAGSSVTGSWAEPCPRLPLFFSRINQPDMTQAPLLKSHKTICECLGCLNREIERAPVCLEQFVPQNF